MALDFSVRGEQPADFAAIRDLTRRAFATLPQASGREPAIVDGLRAVGALPVSLVAVAGSAIVGHAAFSPAQPQPAAEGWYALGPISVEPEFQRRGIGRAPIAHGFEALKALGAHGCILVGNPAYYSRVGFAAAPQFSRAADFADYFMLAGFDGTMPQAPLGFHEAFFNN